MSHIVDCTGENSRFYCSRGALHWSRRSRTAKPLMVAVQVQWRRIYARHWRTGEHFRA